MGIPTVIAAVASGFGAFAAGTTFFGLSVVTSSLLVAGAVGLGLNYLRNITPQPGNVAPTDTDFRVSRPAATTPARYLYGRARIGGHPIYLDEFEYDGDEFVGYRDYQVQVLLVTEGQTPRRGFLEALWLNGRKAPYVPVSGGNFGQIRTGGRRIGGRIHYLGSNTHLDAPISLWESRKTTVRNALPNPDNPPRGVDILLGEIQARIDDLVDRRGRRQQFTPNSTIVGPEDGFQWEDNWQNAKGVETNIRVFEHYGETDVTARGNKIVDRLNQWKRRTLPTFTQTDDVRGTIKWDTENGLLKGISALMLELRDPGPRREAPFLTSPPRTEYLCRGREFTWPGQSTPAWTENAAAVYYDWLVTMQGIDPDTIDRNSFDAAFALCNERIIVPEVSRGDTQADAVLEAQFGEDHGLWPAVAIQDVVLAIWNERYAGEDNAEIRYSINGIVSTDMDPREVERQFNLAWGGYVVERGGMLYFEPGRDRSISRVIKEEHLVEGVSPRWQIEPPVQSRVTSFTATLAQSASHDWLAHTTSKVALPGTDDDSPQDIGTLSYVAYPLTASRLLRQQLFKANGGKEVGLTVNRGHGWAHYGISPTDRLGLSLPTEGHNDDTVKWFVERAATNLEGTVELELSQERDGTYDDVITLPLEVGASARTGGLTPTTRLPPQDFEVDLVGLDFRERENGPDHLGWIVRVLVGGIEPTRGFDLEWVQRRADDTAVDRESLPINGGVFGGAAIRIRFESNEDLSGFRVWDTDPVRNGWSRQWEFRMRHNNGSGFVSRWSDIYVLDLSPDSDTTDTLIAAGLGV